MKLDYINGLFEFCGSIAVWKSIIQLYRQKIVSGISSWTILFFMSWGYFNMFYYPSIDQQFSFIGGCFLALANTIYVLQLLYYIYLYKKEEVFNV